MRTGPDTASERAALHAAIADLLRMGEAAPPLLRRIQPPALQARGTLLEAVVPLREIEGFLEELPAGSDRRFDRLRVLLFDARGRPLGTVGFTREREEYRWLHFTEGGAAPIVDGLGVAEDFEKAEGQRFEARLLVVPDVFQRALVLVPEPPGAPREPRVVPLAPHYGLQAAEAAPMTRDGFRDLLRQILATLPRSVEGRGAGPGAEPA